MYHFMHVAKPLSNNTQPHHRFPNPNRTDLSEIFLLGDPACPPFTSTFSVFAVNNPVDDPEPSLLDEIFGNAPNAIPTRRGVVVRSLTPSLVVVDPEPAVDPEPSAGCAGLEVSWMIRGRIPGTVS